MHCIHVLANLQCLQTFQKGELAEEEHVIDHKAEEGLELEVGGRLGCELNYSFYLLSRAVFFDEVDPRPEFVNDLGIKRLKRSFSVPWLRIGVKHMDSQPEV